MLSMALANLRLLRVRSKAIGLTNGELVGAHLVQQLVRLSNPSKAVHKRVHCAQERYGVVF